MGLYSWRRAAAVSFLAVPLSLMAERSWRRLHRMPRLPSRGERSERDALPSLSIIVPARNEEANLRRLLPTLTCLDYPGRYEVIVVDDHSQDGTAQVATECRARLLSLSSGLPAGWKGKPYACHRAAAEACGEWLLFTDADTIHAADGPARAVTLALAEDLDGLSLLPPVRFFGLADRLALTAAIAGLFAMGAPEHGMLNGQFVLLRREAYRHSGGFGVVRGEALEDVALGHHLRRMGYRVPMVRGEDAMQVRMYEDAPQMWHGLARLGQGALRWWGLRAAISALHITALMSPLIALTGWLARRLSFGWVVATWMAVAVSMWPWSRRAGHPADTLAAPVGALIIQAAALWGVINRLLGRGIIWKGRRV